MKPIQRFSYWVQLAFRSSLLVTLTALTCSSATAQFGGTRIQRPLNRPTVSPYVNLVGSNNASNLAVNYYGITRPQQQFYSQSQNFNQRLNQAQNGNQRGLQSRWNQIGQGGDNQRQTFRRYRLQSTGHPTAFLTIGGTGGGQGGGGAGGNIGGAGGNSNFGGGGTGGGNSFSNFGQGGLGFQNFGGFSSGHTASFGGSRGFQN